jgi:hypothetical protein
MMTAKVYRTISWPQNVTQQTAHYNITTQQLRGKICTN